jgi:hypothetical protein
MHGRTARGHSDHNHQVSAYNSMAYMNVSPPSTRTALLLALHKKKKKVSELRQQFLSMAMLLPTQAQLRGQPVGLAFSKLTWDH